MNTTTEKKPRLTTSAMIASIATEGQRVKAAPFGKALTEYAASRPEIVGMTADLEMAIAAGSTMVRVGTAIFGRR
mgnify:FL=1